MTIVVGRGNKRGTFTIPCAAALARADQNEVRQLHAILCDIIGIKKPE